MKTSSELRGSRGEQKPRLQLVSRNWSLAPLNSDLDQGT